MFVVAVASGCQTWEEICSFCLIRFDMFKKFFPELMDVQAVDTFARTIANWVDIEASTRILP
jgi:hypothetical protein